MLGVTSVWASGAAGVSRGSPLGPGFALDEHVTADDAVGGEERKAYPVSCHEQMVQGQGQSGVLCSQASHQGGEPRSSDDIDDKLQSKAKPSGSARDALW